MRPEQLAAVFIVPVLGLPCCWINLRYDEERRPAHVEAFERFGEIRSRTILGGSRGFAKLVPGVWECGRFTLILGTHTPSPAQVQYARAMDAKRMAPRIAAALRERGE